MKAIVVISTILSLAAAALFFPQLLPAGGSSPLSNSGIESLRTSNCLDRYNSLLNKAKNALIVGDRSASVDFLEQAKRLLPACPALQDGASSPALLTVLQPFKACNVDCTSQADS